MKNLKIICLILLCASIFSMSFTKIPKSDAIIGVWEEDDEVRTIEIYKDGNEYRGKIISNLHSKIDSLKPGTLIMDDFEYNSEDGNWEGIVIIPSRDMKLKAEIEMDDKNHITSKARVAFFSKSKGWHRVNK